MSVFAAAEPRCTGCSGAVELRIEARERDLGGFSVRRVLPARERRMVGPFIFFDHMGPAVFPPGEGIQVRPHPHIGLATITYLFEGEIVHRDSLGFVQPIRPGAVNVMCAGRGITHSERAGDDLATRSALHGIQSWLALPDGEEEREPSFAHHPAASIPELGVEGARVRVILGEAFGRRSPVETWSPTLYLELRVPAGAVVPLPTCSESAVYVVSGEVGIEREALRRGVMAVMRSGADLRVAARSDAHLLFIGGDAPGPREVWWNFVARSPARIERAKEDWKAGRFAPVPGDDEFIPLPE